MTYHVYILRLQDNRLYVGSTSNLNRRLAEHRSGSGSQATAKSPPTARQPHSGSHILVSPEQPIHSQIDKPHLPP
ncbi:MAG: GIY-YIG nuclease family protein [Limisphaerales bacterium]